MMKIAIIGYSGSGKSTLADRMGEFYHLPVLHVDCIHFSSGWVERPDEDAAHDMLEFMETNAECGWVIDGNYQKLLYDRRMQEADRIIFMNFSRFVCFMRAWKRARIYKGKSRSSIAAGCDEKFDFEFINWILVDGRRKKYKQRYRDVQQAYPEKITVIKNQRELDRFVADMK